MFETICVSAAGAVFGAVGKSHLELPIFKWSGVPECRLHARCGTDGYEETLPGRAFAPVNSWLKYWTVADIVFTSASISQRRHNSSTPRVRRSPRLRHRRQLGRRLRQLESTVRKRPVFPSDRGYHRLQWNWIGKSVREPG
jgi:hypothetical protein